MKTGSLPAGADPKTACPIFLLTVEATILPDYRIEPLEIDFGEINGLDPTGLTKKASFRVTPDQLKTLEIAEVKPSIDILAAKILPLEKTESYEIEIELDLSSFTESRAFRGHVVVSTNSETLPKALVTIKAQYVSPVDIQPASLIISSEKSGTTEEEVRIFTSVPSILRRVNCGESCLIRAEFDTAQRSERHDIHLFVAPIEAERTEDLDATIFVELELFPPNGESFSLSKPVSVYRFRNSIQGERK